MTSFCAICGETWPDDELHLCSTSGGRLDPPLEPGDTWRVEVMPGWRGLTLQRTYMAQLLVLRRGQRQYRKITPVMLSDDGPAQALSDLVAHYGLR